jgi:hypothetical protein
MSDVVKNQVSAIDKFVSQIFKPDLIHIEKDSKIDLYKIIFYFDEISDKYIKNPQSKDIKGHKSEMLRREIRRVVNDFMGIKTLGTQPPDYFAPSEFHPINIIVTYTSLDK